MKFETHYYFSDGSHSLDALVLNKCEEDLLNIAYEIIKEFSFPISIESEALKEGGVRDVWKLVGDNSQSLGVVFAGFTALFTGVLAFQGMPNKEFVQIQMVTGQLEIEERQLQIQKLKQELQIGNLDRELLDEAVESISKSGKVLARKSRYYEAIANIQKIEKIGFSSLSDEDEPMSPERIIVKEDFPNFILNSRRLPVDVLENAVLVIVAPVLKEGKSKWKGIFVDEHISFEMNDQIFKQSVLSGSVSFTSGDSIKCVLEIHKELTETGELKINKYVVTDVLDKIEGGKTVETVSGKKYRKEKEMRSKQKAFDF